MHGKILWHSDTDSDTSTPVHSQPHVLIMNSWSMHIWCINLININPFITRLQLHDFHDQNRLSLAVYYISIIMHNNTGQCVSHANSNLPLQKEIKLNLKKIKITRQDCS